jgi:hypothetical protein
MEPVSAAWRTMMHVSVCSEEISARMDRWARMARSLRKTRGRLPWVAVNAREWVRRKLTSRAEDLCQGLALILMCGLALRQGLSTTGDLEWPHDVDLYRDIGYAQSILDGHYWADPLYLGETIWYNPLVPGLVAAVSWVTKLPIHVLYTRMGAYLNLLAPIGFYLLVAYLFDGWTAAAATFGFIFAVGGNAPSWASATYSPWLFSANFVQFLFYVALAVCAKALRAQKHTWYLGVGFFLGITFLGHTAPALILGSIVSASVLRIVVKSWNQGSRSIVVGRALVDLAIVLLVALTVGAPLLYSIVGHYHLRILNPAPSSWVYFRLALSNLPSFIAENLSLPAGIACLGLIALVRQRSQHIGRDLLLFWLMVCCAFLAYGYVWQLAWYCGVHLPSLVPSYHFLFYLKGLEAVLLGCGMVTLTRSAVRLIARLVPFVNRRMSSGSTLKRTERLSLGLLILISLVVAYPTYRSRDDFAAARIAAQHMGQRGDEIRAFTWILEHTRPTDVFLADDHLGLHVVGASGRKVVAVDPCFSNPYVSWEVRASDRDSMLDHLRSGDRGGFGALASKYKVTYVIELANQAQLIAGAVPGGFYQELVGEGVSIYRVAPTVPFP